MALCFAALLPHSPLLVPNIGKEHLGLFTHTIAAARSLAPAIAAADTVVVLTAHGPRQADALICNVSPTFKADFELFGDLVTQWNFKGEIALSARLREQLEGAMPIKLVTEEGLDYGSSIPLSLLGVQSLPLTITPISVSEADRATHAAFGVMLRDLIIDKRRQVAVIASADLSHRLTKKSPAGYSSKAKKLDQKIIQSLLRRDEREFLTIPSRLFEETGAEDGAVIAVLFGLVKELGCEAELLSYEYPFGTGHAVINFRFPHSPAAEAPTRPQS